MSLCHSPTLAVHAKSIVAILHLLVALSLPARIALYHSGGSCVACSYVHTFSYFANMYCSILFLTRWADQSITHHLTLINTVSKYRKNLYLFFTPQYLYRSVPRCCPRIQHPLSLEDHRSCQVCQRHSVVHCSCGHLLFPGKDISTANTTP